MTCSSCLRALQVPGHRDYRPDCHGCSIRHLAHMEPQERERKLDILCHLCGPAARVEVRESVRVEQARIRRLRAACLHR